MKPTPNERSLDSRVTAVESRLEGIEITLGEIKNFVAAASVSRQFTLAHLGVIIAILLGIGGVGASYVNMVTSPLQDKAAISETDRHAMNISLNKLEENLAALLTEVKSNQSALNAKHIEIETQFLSSDQIRNNNQANTLRFIALMWRKTYGEDFPSEIQYYPSISQHDR